MKNARRWLSVLLCMFMMAGIVPVDVITVLAEAEPTAPAETIAAFVEQASVEGLSENDGWEAQDPVETSASDGADAPETDAETPAPTQEMVSEEPTPEAKRHESARSAAAFSRWVRISRRAEARFASIFLRSKENFCPASIGLRRTCSLSIRPVLAISISLAASRPQVTTRQCHSQRRRREQRSPSACAVFA